MQYALQDIRRWGNRKILNYYFRGNFYERLCKVNIGGFDVRVSPYSFAKHWGVLQDSLDGYEGIRLFMLSCEPMIDVIEPDEICKRKFRNTWSKVFKSFCMDTGLDGTKEACLSDLGLRICFMMKSGVAVPRDILDFYNLVLMWAMFTQHESNFTKNNYNCNDIIENMVLLSGVDFNNFVKSLH